MCLDNTVLLACYFCVFSLFILIFFAWFLFVQFLFIVCFLFVCFFFFFERSKCLVVKLVSHFNFSRLVCQLYRLEEQYI